MEGVARFCINGAELVDHPLRIYISADCTIGTINQKKVYITEEADNEIPIQYDSHTGCDYYVGNDNINCRSDVITLQWTTSTSVEIKALTLAFAIQCALTRHPITKSVPVPLDNIYDSKKDITSKADVQFQAQAIEHKPYKQSIFDPSDKDVSVFIRAAGWMMKEDGNFYLVFSSSPPHDVLLMVNYLKVKGKWLMKIVDSDGNKQAIAHGENSGNEFYWLVHHNTIQIGQIYLSKQVTAQSTLQSKNSKIFERSSKQGEIQIFQYFDESNAEVADISFDAGPLVKLEIRGRLTADEKKLVLVCALNRAQVIYTIYKRIPKIVTISSTTCNCTLCEECKNKTGNPDHRSFLENLYIRAAGYSRIKNLVYFDVFSEPFVIHTVECTPRDNQRGIVKLVVKDTRNNVLWTAVQLPRDIFAFYSKENDLVGYQWKNKIFNAQNQEVMHIKQQAYMQKTRFQQESSQKVKFEIVDNNNTLLSNIDKDINCTNIYRPRARVAMAYQSILERIFAIPLAVKINSAVYKLDEWPLPEITYHYENVRGPGKSVF